MGSKQIARMVHAGFRKRQNQPIQTFHSKEGLESKHRVGPAALVRRSETDKLE